MAVEEDRGNADPALHQLLDPSEPGARRVVHLVKDVVLAKGKHRDQVRTVKKCEEIS